MPLKITGTDRPQGMRITDAETGRSVYAEMGATELRLVIRDTGARLEYDQAIEYDLTTLGSARAFLPCPETGLRREIAAVVFKDGGRLAFPRDFSAEGDPEQMDEALPKIAPGGAE